MAADEASRVEEADEAGAALLVPIADILSSQCPRRPASRPSRAARPSGLPYAYRRTGSDAVSFTTRRSTNKQLVPSFDASAVRSRPTMTGSDEARHFRLIFLRHPRFPGHQGVIDASAPSRRVARDDARQTSHPSVLTAGKDPAEPSAQKPSRSDRHRERIRTRLVSKALIIRRVGVVVLGR